MKHKVLLLDYDGVVSLGKLFSEIYSEEFGVELAIMTPFFENLKESTNVGHADLRELLNNVLSEWKWEGTVDELMDYWFTSDSKIDERIVDFARQAKGEGLKVYLATDQEKYRLEFIWENMGLKNWMDGKFVSCELGFLKSNPEFFKKVITDLNVLPSEIIYFDDSESKVNSAKSCGIDAIFYRDFSDLENSVL